MKRAAKVDRNQAEIVKALRQMGCSVQPLSMVGKGCPDLLVGFRGRNHLLEVKDGEKCKSARSLTDDQELWHAIWSGTVVVVNSVDAAVKAVEGTHG